MIALSTYLRSADNLGDVFKARGEAIKHMIADLMETGNFRDRGDAVRQLHADGYPVIDIMILVDEAIFECKQEIVARMMSDVNQGASDDASPLRDHPGMSEALAKVGYGGSAI